MVSASKKHLYWNEGNAEVIRLLVKYGANIKAVTSDGSTALMRAADCGDLGNVEALVDLEVQDMYGKMALVRAVVTGKRAIVHVPASRGADPKLIDNQGDSMLHIATFEEHFKIISDITNMGVEINIRNHKGVTPLFYAVGSGHDELVKLLLKHGASKRITSHFGETPVMLAIGWGVRPLRNFSRKVVVATGYKTP